jgi:hypothetical protein
MSCSAWARILTLALPRKVGGAVNKLTKDRREREREAETTIFRKFKESNKVRHKKEANEK